MRMIGFRRKSANRRLDRRHVLEVKVRSSQVRSRRVRLAVSALVVLASCTVIGLAVWRGGSWLLDQVLFRNQAFALRTVEVQTEGMIAPDQVRQWSGVRAGDNLWTLDLARIRRELLLVPFIESVAVVREPPHTLKLFIVEREPVVQATIHRARDDGYSTSASTYFLDANGYVMPPLESWHGMALNPEWFEGLPSLSGVMAVDLRPGLKVESPKILAALSLLLEFDRSPLVGLADIARIDLASPGVLQVYTGQGHEVVLSPDRFEEQLHRWRLIHDQALKTGRQMAAMDLSISNNIPVRWLVEANPPASIPVPKSPKTSRAKRKHV